MKAIQVKQAGGPETMELVELPVPQPKANDAVVKLAAAGVNFIDVYFREGRYKAPLPLVLGQEGAGVVTALGPDVEVREAWGSGGMGRAAGLLRGVRCPCS
jgi:NADPH2:quinone reductase